MVGGEYNEVSQTFSIFDRRIKSLKTIHKTPFYEKYN